jgi:hypothetical protein
VDLKPLEEGAAAASLAWLALTGVAYVVVFVSDHRKPAHGWLALQSLLLCAFPASVLGLTRGLIDASPIAVVGATVPTACVASVYFTHALFGAGRPGIEWVALLLLGPTVAGLAGVGLVG